MATQNRLGSRPWGFESLLRHHSHRHPARYVPAESGVQPIYRADAGSTHPPEPDLGCDSPPPLPPRGCVDGNGRFQLILLGGWPGHEHVSQSLQVPRAEFEIRLEMVALGPFVP
jgi:hypothetical protein